jgi:hypothetical protein
MGSIENSSEKRREERLIEREFAYRHAESLSIPTIYDDLTPYSFKTVIMLHSFFKTKLKKQNL